MKENFIAVQGRLWLSRQQQNFVGHGRIELLEQIHRCGSITQAAKQMRMSYKAAWDAIEAMNNLSPQPLVLRVTGGKGGGGTQLTAYGKALIDFYRVSEQQHQQFLAQLSQKFAQFDDFSHIIRSICMSTSARNQFLGTVNRLKAGPISAEVVIQLSGGDEIIAVVTQESLNYLNLQIGQLAYALIKAPQIILMSPNNGLRISARNRLCGKVTRIANGPINAEVTLNLQGENTLKAVVTEDAIEELGIAVGQTLCGVFKATQVILAVKEAE